MLLRFDHTFALPLEEVESSFRSPEDWPRLFGLAAATRVLEYFLLLDGRSLLPLSPEHDSSEST